MVFLPNMNCPYSLCVNGFNSVIRRSSLLSSRFRSKNINICLPILKYTTVPVTNKDVEFFGNLSSTWWNGKEMAALHALNEIRVPFIRDGLVNCGVLQKEAAKNRYSLKDVNILDVGCGGGVLSEALARIGANVVGIDPSNDLIGAAMSHASNDLSISKNLEYISTTVTEYSELNSNRFDAVVCSEVIEHVTDKGCFLKDCITTLKPGGSIFLTMPNKTILSWFCTIFLAENLNVVSKGTHSYDSYIYHNDLKELLKSCRLFLKVFLLAITFSIISGNTLLL